MATRMQQRRGTAEQWTLADPVLAVGEIGFETDTGNFKIGNGVDFWFDLPYFENAESLSGSLDDYVPLTQKGAANGVATLDSQGFVPASQLNIDVTGDINAAISALIDSAPGSLDTLNEIAAALNNNSDFYTTITNLINGKADSIHTHLIQDVTDITATAEEVNILEGATLTTEELNYVSGVTSAIQTQIDAKAATSHTHVMAEITDYVEPAGTTLSDTAPSSPASGDRWVKTTTWQEYIYFDGYWVEI